MSINTGNNINTNNKPYCDVCWNRDGKLRGVLQTCSGCGVSVHNGCYGIDGNEQFKQKKENWFCWACLSVGKTIKVRDRDPITNERIEFTIQQRPTECVLCGVDEGIEWFHAMHPLYDDTGLSGRQLVVPKDPKRNRPARLAWAHTLCCYTINAEGTKTAGCITGCTQDGVYNGQDSGDENDDEDTSINSMLQASLEDESDVSIHHFVFALPDRKTGEQNVWTTAIAEHQQLKCWLCGLTDVGTYRIPVQCCANDKHEFDDFKESHWEKHGTEPCYIAQHVGCAMWHKNDSGEYPSVRRVFFYPGATQEEVDKDDDNVPEPVANVFCALHALDLQEQGIGGTKVSNLKYPRDKIAAPSRNPMPTQSQINKGRKINAAARGSPAAAPTSRRQQKKERREKSIRMMQDELSKKLLQFDKKEIIDKNERYTKRVASIYSFYENHLKKQETVEVIRFLFNEALNRVLTKDREIRVGDKQDVIDFLPPSRTAAASTSKSALSIATGTKALRAQRKAQALSASRDRLTQQMTNQSKKLKRVVSSNDNDLSSREVSLVHEENVIDESQVGEWNATVDPVRRPSLEKNLTREQQQQQPPIRRSVITSGYEQLQPMPARHATSDHATIVTQAHSPNHYSVGPDDMDLGTCDATLTSSDSASVTINDFYCNDMVIDILVQKKIQSNAHTGNTQEQEITPLEAFSTKLSLEDTVEGTIAKAKEKWLFKLVAEPNPSLSRTEFDNLWNNNVVPRVYKAFNYVPTPIDWSFLVTDNITQTTEDQYKKFVETWDTYELHTIGNPNDKTKNNVEVL